jgi:diguanylate cyclase (GGDEF)-like protein
VHRILTCLTVQHDYRLVALAGLLCAVAALVTFKIYSRVPASDGLRRGSFLLLTGICCASGIWATHFVSMLAYNAGFPIGFEPLTTAASYVIAAAATTFGFATAASGARWQPFAGGAVIGAGIALMHFTGMRALIIPGVLQWDMTLVAASLVIGIALASAALLHVHRSGARTAPFISAALFVVAVLGLHFTAMDAATIVPDPTITTSASPVDGATMATIVSGVMLVIMLTGIASMALIENQIRRQHEDQLGLQNLRFDMALANMGEGLCMFDADKRLVVCNGLYAKMYRLPPDLLQTGTPHHEIIRHRIVNGILRSEGDTAAAERKIAALSALPAEAPSTRIDEFSDGRLICVTRQPMAGGGWVATHLDVTEQQRSKERITHMAMHDALTGLPNRLRLCETLETALVATRRGVRCLAVLMLDLDRFKEVNDTLGHQVGDALLKAVAGRLRTCTRDTAMIARLGGDEFAIVDDVVEPQADAADLARRIRSALSVPFDLDGYQVTTGTSIGIALAPRDGIEAHEIVKNADLALYRAKDCGGGTHRFFEPGMNESMQVRREIERDMRNALIRGQFELHYQPVVDLKTGEIAGCEALLRWNHPARGLLAPADFIPLAEETGLIVPIGEWVTRAACKRAASWPGDVKVAVNLSPAQFRSAELVPSVSDALKASGLAPHRLELEVTESVMTRDRDTAFDTLDRLRRLGVRIALDDFGTGCSSLAFLQNFPFDKIKIDRTFVGHLLSDKKAPRTMARALVRFAVSLGKITVAEGVESKDQLAILRAEHCTEMQGYYFSEPKPAAEIAAMLEKQAREAIKEASKEAADAA